MDEYVGNDGNMARLKYAEKNLYECYLWPSKHSTSRLGNEAGP